MGRQALADMLGEVSLFSRCSARERRTIARFAETTDLPAGTTLVEEGEAGDALFVVLDGTATVRHGEQILSTVGPGAYFGELAILDGGPRAATVVAETDMTIAVIGIRMFRTLLRELPDLSEQLLIGLAAELRAARAVGAG